MALKDMIIRTGDIPLTLGFLITQFENLKISFITLNFAQQVLADVINKGLKDKSYDLKLQIYNGSYADPFDESKVITTELQKDILDGVLGERIKFCKDDLYYLIEGLGAQNYHFIRTKFINGIFEILKKYIDKHTALCNEKATLLKTTLYQQDWYIMLFILRNNASHADGLHRPFQYPPFIKEKNKLSFTYKTIVIDVNQKAHSIRYNNDEILELYEDMFQFIIANQLLFLTNDEGTFLPDLIPQENFKVS